MRYAHDYDTDLLSVLPILEMKGFWENAVQPVCGGIMMIWFEPGKVNDPARRNAYANGAFILIKRSAYEAIGTHEAVKDRVNEDIHMADRVKRSGLKLRVVRNRGLYVVRMYTSLAQIIRGWGRIFFGTFVTFKRLFVSLLVLVVMSLLPWLTAAAGLIGAGLGLSPQSWWWACGIAGVAVALIQLSVIFRFYRLIGARASLTWTYPIGCSVALLALLVGLSKLRPGARVVWKQTSYVRPAEGTSEAGAADRPDEPAGPVAEGLEDRRAP